MSPSSTSRFSGPQAAPATAAALMQQPLHHPLPGRVARQQQQNNGVPEFQPRVQMGSWVNDDRSHTLSAYLERAASAGELPGAQVHKNSADGRSRQQQQQS